MFIDTVKADVIVGSFISPKLMNTDEYSVLGKYSDKLVTVSPVPSAVISITLPCYGQYMCAFDGKNVWLSGLTGEIIRVSAVGTRVVIATLTLHTSVSTCYDGLYDGEFLWVCGYPDAVLFKVDVDAMVVLATVLLGSYIQQLDFDGEFLWVCGSTYTGSWTYWVKAIDRKSYVTIVQHTVGQYINNTCCVGGNVWASGNNGTVHVFNKQTGLITSVTSPLVSKLLFDGAYVWAIFNNASYVLKYNPVTVTPVATITLGTTFRGIGFDGKYIWLGTNPSSTNGYEQIVDVDTNVIVASFYVVSIVQGHVFDGRYMWLVSPGSYGQIFRVEVI